MAVLRVNVFVPGFGWAGPAYGECPDEFVGAIDERHVVGQEVPVAERVDAFDAALDEAVAPEPEAPPAVDPPPAPKPRGRRTRKATP